MYSREWYSHILSENTLREKYFKQNCRPLLLRSMPKVNLRSKRVQDTHVFSVFSSSSPGSDIRTPVSKKQGRNQRVVVDDEDDVDDDDHDEDNNESNDEISNQL